MVEKQILFEKTIWTANEALKTCHSMLQNSQVIFRTTIPTLDWIKAPEEAWAGLPVDG